MAMVPALESPPPLPLLAPAVAELDAPIAVSDRVDEVVGNAEGVLICVTTTVDGGTGMPLLGATLTTEVMICVDAGGAGAVDVDVVVGAVVVGTTGVVVVGGSGVVVVGTTGVVGGRGVVVGTVVVSGTPTVDIFVKLDQKTESVTK
jgi:hypothetical protein